MSKKAKIIIGANYGDESKGLTAAYFVRRAKNDNKRCLNILFNGGPQRGHTVETKNGFRHVFHHFGSGTVYGAPTYFDENALVNPMVFTDEYLKLTEMGVPIPTPILNPSCRIITVYDMFINQIVETIRSGSKHGSCGHGVWEAVQRNKVPTYSLTYSQFTQMSKDEVLAFLTKIRTEYLPARLNFYNITTEMIPSEYQELLSMHNGMDRHYYEDMLFMASKCDCKAWEAMVEDYDTFIFEGSQGLALDADNVPMKPYVTASNTGASIPVSRIAPYTDDVEVVYVTRSYFTRHGAGPLPTECPKEEIDSRIGVDATNQPNAWQDTLRYGRFDWKELRERVDEDVKKIETPVTVSLMVTHVNECEVGEEVREWRGAIYTSNSPYPNDVQISL